MSKASTLAPNLLAVAIACNPATPTPTINTLAGDIVPAAVIIIGKDFERVLEASITAAYPAKLAWELKASIFCALVILGTNSILIELTPTEANSDTICFSLNGSRKLIYIESLVNN